MGQKVRPTGFRTGIMIDTLSRWYPPTKQDYGTLLLEDFRIRSYIHKFTPKGRGKDIKPLKELVARIIIERTREQVTVYIHAARVGAIIGKSGETIEKLKKQLENLTRRKIEIKTIEIGRPEIDAQLVALDIADQLAKRQSFRRTMKKSIEMAMQNGAKGIKVQMAGRLGGAEMARCEIGVEGSVPLSTLRARVDYGFAEASTAQGNIGVKVWIHNGDHLTAEEPDNGANAQTSKVSKKPTRQGKR